VLPVVLNDSAAAEQKLPTKLLTGLKPARVVALIASPSWMAAYPSHFISRDMPLTAPGSIQ